MYQDGLIYADSRMSSKEEFLENLKPVHMTAPADTWPGGPVLYRDNDSVYVDDSELHTLMVGGTGSMKTLRYVLPLIYSCAKAGESMVVVDPKGELVKRSGAYLYKSGYKIRVLDFRNPQNSPDRWNPFGRIQTLINTKKATDRETAIILLNDVLQQLFFSRSSADKDIYWNESAGMFALGILELLIKNRKELSMKNLLRMRYEELSNGKLEKMYRSLPSESPAFQNLSVYMGLTAENTKSCILSTFDQLVRIFKSSPALTDMLSASTFDMNEIVEKKTAFFLVVPDEKTTYHFIASIFINSCYEFLLERADKYDGRIPRRIHFILEEFCNMPELPEIVPMLTAARSRNIRFHLVIQSYEQLVSKYNEHISRTILDNCGNLVYLHCRELSFLKYISELSGTNEFGRPVLSVARLQRLRKNENIIFHDRCYPYLVQDIPLIFEYQ